MENKRVIYRNIRMICNHPEEAQCSFREDTENKPDDDSECHLADHRRQLCPYFAHRDRPESSGGSSVDPIDSAEESESKSDADKVAEILANEYSPFSGIAGMGSGIVNVSDELLDALSAPYNKENQ